MELPKIPQFYTKKTIFITGGSGFIGKVLIEKLLRSCPDLNKIYLLTREKKGQSPEERIKSVTDIPLFQVLKLQNPQSLTKIEIVKGNVKMINLGLSYQDRKKLIDEVNIVFHGAASVRFDDSLTDAVLLNTRGTREIATLALEMKNLEVLVHISTTYCNCDKKVVEEKLYPAQADWRKTIEIAENVDRNILNTLTAKYIGPMPNTYTFVKGLAEHVVYDTCAGRIPTVVLRPSIIVPTAHEPFPGWLDSFGGPISLLITWGKGMQHSAFLDPNVIFNCVPVDLTVKAMIIASWKQATTKNESQKLSPSFYNCSSFDPFSITNAEMVGMGEAITLDVPLENVVWYPAYKIVKSYHRFLLRFLVYDYVLAVIFDGLLKLFGRKPMMMKIQRKIFTTVLALSHFTHNQWHFVNEKCANLENSLLPRDCDAFSYKNDEVDIVEYYRQAVLGARMYLLKEGNNLEKAKKHLFRMWVMSKAFNNLYYFLLLWLIFVKIDIISLIIYQYHNVLLYIWD